MTRKMSRVISRWRSWSRNRKKNRRLSLRSWRGKWTRPERLTRRR